MFLVGPSFRSHTARTIWTDGCARKDSRRTERKRGDMGRAEIKAWAKLMNVSTYYIRRELQRERNLERARMEPDRWIMLKYPNGEINAFPSCMFPGEEARAAAA